MYILCRIFRMGSVSQMVQAAKGKTFGQGSSRSGSGGEFFFFLRRVKLPFCPSVYFPPNLCLSSSFSFFLPATQQVRDDRQRRGRCETAEAQRAAWEKSTRHGSLAGRL